MKSLIPIYLGIIILISSCNAPKPEETSIADDHSDDLIGVWKMTEIIMEYPDTTIVMGESDAPSRKLLTATHFSFGFQETDSTIVAGGGTYTYDGDTYAETLKYHSVPGVAGETITFEAEVDGNTWKHSGTIPSENGDILLKETWVRVE